MLNAGHQITKPNSHYGAGVGALLRLALPDEEGPVTLAPQHFLSLGAFDVTHIPGTLVVVGRALVFLQRVGAANEETNAVTSCPQTNAELQPLPKLQVEIQRQPVITKQVAELGLHPEHLLISVVLYAQPFVDLFLPRPLLCQPSAKSQQDGFNPEKQTIRSGSRV